jgi:hypothetical protein
MMKTAFNAAVAGAFNGGGSVRWGLTAAAFDGDGV